MAKGTGSRGVQIFPRGKKWRDNWENIFRPENGSKDKPTESQDNPKTR